MIKKTIIYEDFNGKVRTEDFYFHLSKVEVLRVLAQGKGGLEDNLARLSREGDTQAAFKLIEEIVQRAYGQKTADGAGFEHDPKALAYFMSTNAYSDFVVELLENDGAKYLEFVSALVAGGRKMKNQTELPGIE